jgi:hypothetical protein
MWPSTRLTSTDGPRGSLEADAVKQARSVTGSGLFAPEVSQKEEHATSLLSGSNIEIFQPN